VTVRELLRTPDPLDTLEAWAQYGHRDLVDYDRPELALERGRLRLALLLVDDRSTRWRELRRMAWLRDRLIQVEHRLRHRPAGR
jgi:hypothetical protein